MVLSTVSLFSTTLSEKALLRSGASKRSKRSRRPAPRGTTGRPWIPKGWRWTPPRRLWLLAQLCRRRPTRVLWGGRLLRPRRFRGTRPRRSEYARFLQELRRFQSFYGWMPRSMLRDLMLQALKARGSYKSAFLALLERRLDVVLYRCGWARSLATARQWISHKKVLCNGQVLTSPSRVLVPGDVITVVPELKDRLRAQLCGRATRGLVRVCGFHGLDLLPLATGAWLEAERSGRARLHRRCWYTDLFSPERWTRQGGRFHFLLPHQEARCEQDFADLLAFHAEEQARLKRAPQVQWLGRRLRRARLHPPRLLTTLLPSVCRRIRVTPEGHREEPLTASSPGVAPLFSLGSRTQSVQHDSFTASVKRKSFTASVKRDALCLSKARIHDLLSTFRSHLREAGCRSLATLPKGFTLCVFRDTVEPLRRTLWVPWFWELRQLMRRRLRGLSTASSLRRPPTHVEVSYRSLTLIVVREPHQVVLPWIPDCELLRRGLTG
jgi:ribosomal protein S4